MVFVRTECSTQEDLEEREKNFTRRNTGKDPLPVMQSSGGTGKGRGEPLNIVINKIQYHCVFHSVFKWH